jgi:hypothetical protein
MFLLSVSWQRLLTLQITMKSSCHFLFNHIRMSTLQNSIQFSNIQSSQSQSKSYLVTYGLSASLSGKKAPIWGLRPDLYYCITIVGLLMWGALSDETTGLSFSRVTVRGNKSGFQYVQFIFYMLLNAYPIYTRPLSVHAQYSRSCL